MRFNHRILGFAMFFVLAVFSVPTSAQTGFYRSPAGKTAVGMGYQRYRPPERTEAPFRFSAQTILGSLDYTFSPDLKMSLLPGISFFETDTQNPYQIAPSPSLDLRFLNVNDMNMTGLKFFLSGGFRTQYTNIGRTGNLPLHSINMALRGGMGFLHLLDTGYEWNLKPFFGLFYTQAWNNVSTTKKVHVNSAQNFFTGEAGLEIELSPTMSALGSIEFSFENSELLYRFGLNFHQASTRNGAVQAEVQTGGIVQEDREHVGEASAIDYDPHIEVAGPQYKFKVDPVYPEDAKNAEKTGEVVLEATINEEGIPIDIVERTTLGFGLEAAAAEALKKTTFYPAIWNGTPIATRVTITYTFNIKKNQ